jgi:2-dehydro-3-deoxygluconokinase
MADIADRPKKSVLTIGECMVSIELEPGRPLGYRQPARIGVAGAESTVAAALARLGHDAIWCSALGDDELGGIVREALRASGVDVVAARRDGQPTGMMVRETGVLGNRVNYVRRGSAGATLRPEDLAPHVLSRADWIHSSGITASISSETHATLAWLVEQAAESRTPVSIDVNLRQKLISPPEAKRRLEPLLRHAALVVAGVDETDAIWGGVAPQDRLGSAAERLAEVTRAPEIVVTDGAQGSLVRAGGQTWRSGAVLTTVVDPVGAGDAYTGAYIAATLWGWPPAERLRCASVVGAFAVSALGDLDGLPDRERLLAALTQGLADVER